MFTEHDSCRCVWKYFVHMPWESNISNACFVVETSESLDRDVIIGIAVGVAAAVALTGIIVVLFCLHLRRTR